MIEPAWHDCDQVAGFTLPFLHARGRLARLGPVLDTILAAHDYPPPVRTLLAEALVLAALMGALLKGEDDQLTLQLQARGEAGDGAIDLLVADYRAGALRGYARFDAARTAALPPAPGLRQLCGNATMAITFDLAETRERYQGIVALEGASLAEACERYFAQSEQVPTRIVLAIAGLPGAMRAGGFLVQHLPEGEQGRERLHVRMDHPEWEHVAILSGTLAGDELTDPALRFETLLWRLFHEEREVRLGSIQPLSRGCRCTPEHFASVLAQFPEGERAAMRDEAGLIQVDCAFCSRLFPISL